MTDKSRDAILEAEWYRVAPTPKQHDFEELIYFCEQNYQVIAAYKDMALMLDEFRNRKGRKG